MPVGLLSPPRYGEQRCPLVACSDVIGSNVTNVLVWKRQLTASPLPQPLAGGGAHALRAWHAAAVEKKRTAGVAVRRLVLAPRRVDWPAQPSLDSPVIGYLSHGTPGRAAAIGIWAVAR